MAAQTAARRVLVTGLPAVGKSSVCRLVAEGLPRSTVIEADVVRESIVGGYVQPRGLTFDDDLVEQIRLQREIVNLWADRMVDAGYHAVVDDAPIPPTPLFQQQYAALLADPTAIAVLLTASGDALRSRSIARNGPFDEVYLGFVDEAFRAMEESLADASAWSGWTIIDTTELAPREVAALVLERL